MDPLIGRSLGPYRLLGRLGTGGMGTVYRAVHYLLDQPRAVKVLPAELAGDERFVERFQREARTAAGLRHPNIVVIHDVGEHHGAYFIAMELVDGRTLRQILRAEGSLALLRATRLLAQLADALDFAHARGVVHRDVKPANVLVRPDDHLVLADFGIARAGGAAQLTQAGTVVGTPEYLAPEAVRGAEPGASADLYALGVVAYELLCGRTPFAELSTPAMLYAHLHTPPPAPRQLRPDLPAAVEQALLRQLAKDPAERYPSGSAFVHALERARRPAPAPIVSEDVPTPPHGIRFASEWTPPPAPPRVLASTWPPHGDSPDTAGIRSTAGRVDPTSEAPGGRRGWIAVLLVGTTLASGLIALGLLWLYGRPLLESASINVVLGLPTPTIAAPRATPEPATTAPPEQGELLIARETPVPTATTAPAPTASPIAVAALRPLASPSPAMPASPAPSPQAPAAAGPSPTAAPTSRVEILSPADGASVPEQLTITGRLNQPLPPGSHLWLVVRPLVDGGRWYPSHGEIVAGPDGTWATELHFGGPSGIRHEIRVGTVDAAAHAQLSAHLADRRDEPLSTWTPPDDWGDARAIVTKQ